MPGDNAVPGAGRAASSPGRRYKPVSLSPARRSGQLVIRIAPRDVGLFRFLLEARDNLALFTVLDSRAALLKLLFSPHQERDVREALVAMQAMLTFDVEPWPCPDAAKASCSPLFPRAKSPNQVIHWKN